MMTPRLLRSWLKEKEKQRKANKEEEEDVHKQRTKTTAGKMVNKGRGKKKQDESAPQSPPRQYNRFKRPKPYVFESFNDIEYIMLSRAFWVPLKADWAVDFHKGTLLVQENFPLLGVNHPRCNGFPLWLHESAIDARTIVEAIHEGVISYCDQCLKLMALLSLSIIPIFILLKCSHNAQRAQLIHWGDLKEEDEEEEEMEEEELEVGIQFVDCLSSTPTGVENLMLLTFVSSRGRNLKGLFIKYLKRRRKNLL
ncbi:hypothetical protein E2542_SST04563 [Spatholobus suberectus]|nr:hypothetical protein E2542_SST04563 [Spatholobus suberectus]